MVSPSGVVSSDVAAGAAGEVVRRAGDVVAPVDAGEDARRLAGGEEVRLTVRHPGRQGAQRRQIVEDPDRAAVGAGDEVAALDQDVVDGRDGQVRLQRRQVAPSSKETYRPVSVPA